MAVIRKLYLHNPSEAPVLEPVDLPDLRGGQPQRVQVVQELADNAGVENLQLSGAGYSGVGPDAT